MKLKEMMTRLETEFNEKWVGKRFEDISDVHADFFEIASTILPKGWDSYAWQIFLEDGHLDLLTYDLDIKDDKRFRATRAGRVNGLTVKPILPITNDTTIEEYALNIQRKEVERAVQVAEKAVDNLEKDLLKYKADLQRKKEELASFAQ